MFKTVTQLTLKDSYNLHIPINAPHMTQITETWRTSVEPLLVRWDFVDEEVLLPTGQMVTGFFNCCTMSTIIHEAVFSPCCKLSSIIPPNTENLDHLITFTITIIQWGLTNLVRGREAKFEADVYEPHYNNALRHIQDLRSEGPITTLDRFSEFTASILTQKCVRRLGHRLDIFSGRVFSQLLSLFGVARKAEEAIILCSFGFFSGFPPKFRREVLKYLDSPSRRVTVSSLMASVKQVLALGNGVWKCSEANSSRAQPSRASDNHSPRRSYSFCFFCGLSGHIRAGCHSFKSYLASGKCLLVNGRVVLPTGLEIPREVAGRTLRDRLANWSSLTSQFEACMGSSPARSLSLTAAPSRCVFNAPSHIPAQTSIVSTQSLPTLQLEPAVPDPPPVQSSTVEVATWPRPVALASSFTLALADSNRLLTPFFLVIVVVVLALALSFTFEEGVFIHPFQTEAVAQPQSHAPALSKSALTLHYGSTYIVTRNFWLEFPTERRLASHPAPSHTLHDSSHPQIQFRQGTLSTRPPSTLLVARQGGYYLPRTERVSRSLSRRASRFLEGSYYSTSALCRYQARLHAPSRSGDIRVFVDRSILRVLWSYLARSRVAPLAFGEDCIPRRMLHVDIRIVLIGPVAPEIFAFLCEGPSSRSCHSRSRSSTSLLSLFGSFIPLAEPFLGMPTL
ncbi:hypothetical protein F5J12DRAFT_896407 [Pisolithus orientalis]|uniref:uncharacterized protein n=1 Tax=Pisolithus orientalis TaxID=936130 RepID=UPI0022247098|nr:uncharacterized protein F5J12DRAFT_896407 [Pisolithus orientalis]KAI5995779.1 hypothetical protein F5J12DRAFT_896407 [Pisolithus orientalis]